MLQIGPDLMLIVEILAVYEPITLYSDATTTMCIYKLEDKIAAS